MADKPIERFALDPAGLPLFKNSTREDLLTMMPKGLVCAEVGVLNGDFSQKILDITDPIQLYLIDPWKEQDKDKYNDGANVVQDKQEVRYKNVCKKFGGMGKVYIYRGYSYHELFKMSLQQEPYKLDWVYIDGNHSYPIVYRDIIAAELALKKTGFIAGHDYSPGARDGTPFGVIEALNDFLAANPEWKLRYLSDERWSTWVISREELEWLK